MTVQSIHDLRPLLAANRKFWCGWSGSLPDTDLPIYRSDVQHPLLNGVLRVRNWPVARAFDEAERVLRGVRWSWWVSDDSDPGTAGPLIARGAVQTGDLPVMAVDVTAYNAVAPPPELWVRPVTGRAEMHEYVRAYAKPLGFAVDDVETVVDREMSFAYPDVVRLAGIVDGRTVGTCTLSLGAEVAAIYCVATDPQYRKRGIASALTVEALRITADSGRRIATLQASDEGVSLYRRIGFETVSRYRRFEFPA